MRFVLLVVLFFGSLDIVLAQYELRKAREFQINSLKSVDIVDFYEAKNLFLAYEKYSKGHVVVVLDSDGNILSRKDLRGQGPGKFDSSMNFLGFTGKGEVLIITPTLWMVYDLQLRFICQMRFSNPRPVFTSKMAESPVIFYPDGDGKRVLFVSYPSRSAVFSGLETLKNSSLVEMLSLSGESSFKVGPIAERPVYGRLDPSVFPMYTPIFSLGRKRGRINITASLDDEITVVDLQSKELVSKISIKHGDFDSFDEVPIAANSLPVYPPYTLASFNHKLIALDNDLLVLDYFRAIPYELFEAKIADNPLYHHSRDSRYHRLIVFKGNKQVTGDLRLPPNAELMIGLPGGRLLMKVVDEDEEQDFIQYAIFDLVSSD